MKFICSFSAYLVLTLSTVTILTPATAAENHPGPTSQSAPDKLLPEASRKTAPGFSLTDANGKAINLSDYRGKVVLLDFWATWCGGCKLEIPWYTGVRQEI